MNQKDKRSAVLVISEAEWTKKIRGLLCWLPLSSNAIREPFCSHRQPRGAALAPHPSACVEQSSSRIDKATISSSLSSCLSLSLSLSLSLVVLFFLKLTLFLSGATTIFPFYSRTQRRSVYSCDGTHSTRWARVRESRVRRLNSSYFWLYFYCSTARLARGY